MPDQGESLTEREKEILQMVATGATNRQIAHRLHISVNTVKVHLRNIFAKMGAESRTEATMMAVREGWVPVEGDGEAATSQEAAIAQARFPTVAPASPLRLRSGQALPWFKRLALIAATLMAAGGVALTWPRTTPQAENGADLPFDQLQEHSIVTFTAAPESLWHERAQMPTRRAHLALAVAAGRILAIGGRTPAGVTAALEMYDPVSDTWRPGREKTTPVAYALAATIGSQVYVPGGCDAQAMPVSIVEVYDVSSDSWHQVSPLPQPRCAYALGLLNGRIYVFGGWDGKLYVATVYVYDPQADTWAEGAPLGTARGFAAAAPLGGHLYLVGGYDGKQELTTCTIYDPMAEEQAHCAPLAVGRGGLGLVALNGQLYAIGGGGWTSYLGFNERLHPDHDHWSVVETPLVREWRGPGVTVYETSIYAIGGLSNDYLSLNQVYEPLPFRTFIPISSQ